MLLEVILVLMSIPAGFLVSYLARDELVAGKRWFLALMALSFVGIGIFFFMGLNSWAFTSGFIFIFTGVSLLMSYSKKWTKKV
jgi:hypothetical protein